MKSVSELINLRTITRPLLLAFLTIGVGTSQPMSPKTARAAGLERSKAKYQTSTPALDTTTREIMHLSFYLITEELLIQLPDDLARTHYNQGNAWSTRKEYDKAIAEFTDAIRLEPNHNMAYIGRGNALLKKGDHDKALADCNAAIQINPRVGVAYSVRAIVWLGKGDATKAFADFDESIRLDPTDPEVYSWRAEIYLAMKDSERALADLKEAIRLDPKHPHAYNIRANIQNFKGEYDQAISDCNQAILLDPGNTLNALPYFTRGLAWFKKGDYDKAISDFDSGISINKNADTQYLARGDVWFAKKKYDKAISDYEEAIRVKPTHPMAYKKLAWLRATCSDAKLRDGIKAVESAKQACQLSDWKDAYAIATLAAAYAESRDFKSAIEFQERANRMLSDPKDTEKGQERLESYRRQKPYHEAS